MLSRPARISCETWMASEQPGWANFRTASFSDTRNFTIYSDEGLKEQAKGVDVPLQIMYEGPARAIPSSLADRSCVELQVDGMLQELNSVMETSYTLETPGLRSVLQTCVDRDYDFGAAYGRIRQYWCAADPEPDFSGLLGKLSEAEQDDAEMRASALDREKSRVTQPRLPPRRMWDLYSNRVLPWWAIGAVRYLPHPISHCWMEEKLRQNVWTPINAEEWPVPIPIDTTLDRIRVELLNLHPTNEDYFLGGYVWLDVLCLRQKKPKLNGDGVEEDPESKAVRFEEWAVDVPTIGAMYQDTWATEVVIYYSGVGRPFVVGDVDGRRHWLNRAWTMQESKMNTVLAGIAEYSPKVEELQTRGRVDDESSDTEQGGGGLEDKRAEESTGKTLYKEGDQSEPPSVLDHATEPSDPDLARFREKLTQIHTFVTLNGVDGVGIGSTIYGASVFDALSLMRTRFAEGEQDKIAGLAYLLKSDFVPAYIPDEDPEHTWGRLVESMALKYRQHLLFMYPAPGDGECTWRPTWQQVKDTPTLPSLKDGSFLKSFHQSSFLTCDEEWDGSAYGCSVHIIMYCTVVGFDKADPEGRPRRGQVLVRIGETRSVESFAATAYHQHPIPEAAYSLVASNIGGPDCYEYVAVTRGTKERRIGKISVLRMQFKSEEERAKLASFCQHGLAYFV